MDDLTDLFNDSEQDLPARDHLKRLTTSWVNEKNAPELLKYAAEDVDVMLYQLDEMEKNLRFLMRDDFRVVPHQMEVNRIRFILASYHRCRLCKIETFAAHLLNHDRNCGDPEDLLMSSGEFTFAEQFVQNLDDHFHEEAYRYMPNVLSGEGSSSNMNLTPNLNSSVFMRMLKTSNDIIINDNTVKLTAGSRHLLPYRMVAHLIKNGSAVLI